MRVLGNAVLTAPHGTSGIAASYAVLGGVSDWKVAPRLCPDEPSARKVRKRKPLHSATLPTGGEIERRDLYERGYRFYFRPAGNGDAWRRKRALIWLRKLRETKDQSDLQNVIADRIVALRDDALITELAEIVYRQHHRPQASVRGDDSPNRKLVEDQVRAIRFLYRTGQYSRGILAKQFGVSQKTIGDIVAGGTWRHVDGPRHVEKASLEARALLAQIGIPAACDEPIISAQEGSQDSTGTFSSPTVLPCAEDGRNVPTASVEMTESSREKSPGVTKSSKTLRTGFQPMPTVGKQQVAEFITAFCDLYKQHRKAAYFVRRPKDLTLARMLLDTYDAGDLKAMVTDLLTVADDWIAGTDRGIGILTVKASWLAGRLADAKVLTVRKHWSEECTEIHGGTCVKRWDHEMRKRESA